MNKESFGYTLALLFVAATLLYVVLSIVNVQQETRYENIARGLKTSLSN